MALLSDVIKEYQDSRKARGIAQGTLRNEAVVLRQFLASTGNFQVHNYTGKHVDQWLSSVSYKAPATLNRDMTFVRKFFEWCRGRNYARKDQDPMAGVASRRTVLRDALFIDKAEFPTILASAEDPRDRIIAALGMYMFLGRAEINRMLFQHAHIDDPKPESWYIQVWRKKTGKYDEKPVAEELYHELLRWRLHYQSRIGFAIEAPWYVVPSYRPGVFVHGRMSRLPERTINPLRGYKATEEAVKRLLKPLGYTDEELRGEGNHVFRRSGARALYNELTWDRTVSHDGAMQLVQSMLGHESVQTTERYLRLELDKKRRRDILAGKQMFTIKEEAKVIHLGEAAAARQ